jgi:hypothetical protein
MCGKGFLEPARIREEMYGVDLGTYEGEKCSECGETFLQPDEVRRSEEKAKELGIWGLESRVKIGKSGHSLIIRIPTRLAEFMKLKKGEDLCIFPEGENKLILEPVTKRL